MDTKVQEENTASIFRAKVQAVCSSKFICSLLNDAVTSSDYMASNVRLISNN
jgi:hypothetical protein